MRLLHSLLLLLAALLLFVTIAPFGLLVGLVMLFVKDSRERYPDLADYVMAINIAIDILGNVLCGALFNITLVKHGGYLFGRPGETVSSALGVNEYTGTLSKTGKKLAGLLDALEKDHCRKAAWAYHMKQREKLPE